MLPLGWFLVVSNTCFFSLPMFLVGTIKLLMPVDAWRDPFRRALSAIAETWARVINGLICNFTKTRWEFEGLEGLEKRESYMVICNHQSWVDIPVTLMVFNRRIPYLKFFLKQQLIWVPILGYAWWILDYPFMKRYSREQIAKNPSLKGKDLATTRKQCAHFRSMPVAILNYLEGTRFTDEKHARTKSPYRHLLPPKAGGLAYTLAAMGDHLDAMLDVTIVYPHGRPTVTDLFANRIRQVKVIVERRELPREMVEGDYQDDEAFRKRFQTWVSDMWSAKDDLIEKNTIT